MSELQVVEKKEVDFQGVELKAVKAEDGNVYVGMKWVLKGVGFTDRKGRAETTKAQEDEVVSRGIRNFGLPTAGGKQEVKCLDIEFLPIWLAKISITPKIKEDNPKVTWRMTQFQLKAKDVLAEAFLENKKPNNQFDLMRQMVDELEEATREAKQAQEVSNRAIELSQKNNNKIENLSEKVDFEIEQDDVKASQIAHHLNLTTAKSGNAHNQLISAIAKKLRFKVGYPGTYRSDYIKIVQADDYYQVYYTPEGQEEIISWFEDNKEDVSYQETYKRGGKYGDAGDIKEAGYKVNGTKYKTYMAKYDKEGAV